MRFEAFCARLCHRLVRHLGEHAGMAVEGAADAAAGAHFGKHRLDHLAIGVATRFPFRVIRLQAAHVGVHLLHPQLDQRVGHRGENDVRLLDGGPRTRPHVRAEHHAGADAGQTSPFRHAGAAPEAACNLAVGRALCKRSVRKCASRHAAVASAPRPGDRLPRRRNPTQSRACASARPPRHGPVHAASTAVSGRFRQRCDRPGRRSLRWRSPALARPAAAERRLRPRCDRRDRRPVPSVRTFLANRLRTTSSSARAAGSAAICRNTRPNAPCAASRDNGGPTRAMTAGSV